mmetsp:Transcript_20979/g.41128  ORF Transcript_20979/g.41128 Transcript_20979/m.41128 type:complete len:210 (-) Transcript_20979:99-728(-)
MTSSTATASPGCLSHSTRSPWVTASPIAGTGMVVTSPVAAGSAAASDAFSGAGWVASLGLGEEAASSEASISAMGWFVLTVSSILASWATRVPAAGERISTATLSVSMTQMTSSISTRSPGCLSHSTRSPDVTASPMAGTGTVIFSKRAHEARKLRDETPETMREAFDRPGAKAETPAEAPWRCGRALLAETAARMAVRESIVCACEGK